MVSGFVLGHFPHGRRLPSRLRLQPDSLADVANVESVVGLLRRVKSANARVAVPVSLVQDWVWQACLLLTLGYPPLHPLTQHADNVWVSFSEGGYAANNTKTETEILHMDDKVETLLAEVLQMPVAQITDNLAMKDVEAWDSLKHMELVVSLEETFGIELTFDEIVAMQSVREIKRTLRERGGTG